VEGFYVFTKVGGKKEYENGCFAIEADGGRQRARHSRGMATLYPAEMVEYVRAARAHGRTKMELSRELGVHPDTIKKWTNGKLRNGPGKRAAPRVVLTADQVREIRRLRLEEGLSQDELAVRFGTMPSAIGRIVRGETYKVAGGPTLKPHVRALNRKLTAAKVAEIRALRQGNPGGDGVRWLAARFGVSRAMVYLVLAGDAWANA
jgi:transcriptional regulator with XRE-family HTH domain